MSAEAARGPSTAWIVRVGLVLLAPIVLTGGALAWLTFLFAAIVARRPAWLGTAGGYAAITIALNIAAGQSRGGFDGVLALLWGVVGVAATIAAIRRLPEWVERLWLLRHPEDRAGATAGAGSTAAPGADPLRVERARAASAFREYLARPRCLAAAALAKTAPPVDSPPLDPAPAGPAPSVDQPPADPLPVDPPTTEPPPPAHRSASAWTPTTVLPSLDPVDPRTASVDEIAAIPGVGRERATAFAAAREGLTVTSASEFAAALGLPSYDAVRIAPYLRFPLADADGSG